MEVVDALEINGPPTSEDIKRIVEIGRMLAKNSLQNP